MMKTIFRTYKFRLKPNSEQRELLAKHFGCARFVFNHFLGKIDRYYPSSKTCHTCGYVNRGLGYEEEWVCPECGAVIDRDWNAALNILSAGLAEYTCGLSENPVWVGRKSEARTPLIH